MPAAIAQEEPEVRLRKEGEVLVRGGVGGVEQVWAGGAFGTQSRIEVIVLSPDEIVTIQAVLGDAERCGLVGIVSKALRREGELVEEMAMALAGVDTE